MKEKRRSIAYRKVSQRNLSQSVRPSLTFRWIFKIIIFIILTIFLFIIYRFITAEHAHGVRPPMIAEQPIYGEFHCPNALLKPSEKTPDDVNQVRPADITYIAALGDSITSGTLSYDLPSEFNHFKWDFVGNSFSMGGDGGMETHLTLPNILRHLNPNLTGFSVGRGLEVKNSALNVAFPGRWSDDFPRQATELVERFKEYPAASVQNGWKLINFFIGTNDITGICRKNAGTSKEDYKNFLLTAIRTIQKNIPRSIISLIGMWNLDFQWRAKQIIYNTTYQCSKDFENKAQERTVEYREALNELAADASLQSKTQAVVVQRVFDDLMTPLKKSDGSYDVNFYATDVFHLSKYGNSLVAKQLWKQLIQPVGSKATTNGEMASNNPELACPYKDCPFIRTIANSQHCVIPDYGTAAKN